MENILAERKIFSEIFFMREGSNLSINVYEHHTIALSKFRIFKRVKAVNRDILSDIKINKSLHCHLFNAFSLCDIEGRLNVEN